MIDRIPANLRDMAARLPLKVFLAAKGSNDMSAADVRRLSKALASGDSVASEIGRAVFRLAASSFPAHFREFAARNLVDDPERIRDGLNAIASSVSDQAALDMRGDLLGFLRATGMENQLPVIEEIFSGSAPRTARSRRGPMKQYQAPALPDLFRPDERPAGGQDEAGMLSDSTLFEARVISPDEVTWWKKGEIDATVVRTIDETPDVRTFVFRVRPETWFSYLPGQFITLELDIAGEKVKRSYSLGSSPSRPQTLEITVKRAAAPRPDLPPGVVSNWLHDNLKVGDMLRMKGPNGRFTCAGDANKKLLFISAGSGIVPLMGMSRFLCDTHADCDIIFYHSARAMEDFIYRRELERMASYYSNFRLVLTVTRPHDLDPYYGFTGRISRSQLEIGFPDFKERSVYLCGPNPFMESVKQILQEAGFPMKQFHWESFGGANTPKPTTAAKQEIAERASHGLPVKAEQVSSTAQVETVTVVFEKSGKEVKCLASDYLLDVAEEAGVEIEFSCRSGSCGECKVVKKEGNVAMEADDGLLDDDRASGFVLTCVGTPSGRVVLDA